ncbi:MAG TPA: hypothetical protein VGH19_03460 [Verrucomicrobiae bacterium]
MKAVLTTLALAILPLMDVQGATIDTFKTGIDESTGNVLADNAADVNWTIVSLTGGSDGSFPRAAVATGKEPGWHSSIPMAGTGLITRGTDWNGQNGTYAYQYQFTANTASYTNFAVGGLAWADDQVRVLLNGNEIMAMSSTIWNANPVSFTNATQAYFVNGLNTLTFEVYNSGGGPTALNVSGIVTATPIPEAHEWAMMLLALGMVGYFRREQIAEWWNRQQAQITT